MATTTELKIVFIVMQILAWILIFPLAIALTQSLQLLANPVVYCSLGFGIFLSSAAVMLGKGNLRGFIHLRLAVVILALLPVIVRGAPEDLLSVLVSIAIWATLAFAYISFEGWIRGELESAV